MDRIPETRAILQQELEAMMNEALAAECAAWDVYHEMPNGPGLREQTRRIYQAAKAHRENGELGGLVELAARMGFEIESIWEPNAKGYVIGYTVIDAWAKEPTP